MDRTLIWVINGPDAGTFMEVDLAEASQAEAEGWAQKTVRDDGRPRDGTDMKPAVKGPHKAAEAFRNRRLGGYANRELRSDGPPRPAPAAEAEAEAATPAPKRRGRPPKPK